MLSTENYSNIHYFNGVPKYTIFKSIKRMLPIPRQKDYNQLVEMIDSDIIKRNNV